jgi:hypothetical protein
MEVALPKRIGVVNLPSTPVTAVPSTRQVASFALLPSMRSGRLAAGDLSSKFNCADIETEFQ